MKLARNRSRAAGVLGLAVIIVVAAPAWAQTGRVAGGSVSQATFGFYWETRLDPASPPLSESFWTEATDEPGVVHRFMFDRTQNIFVGYDALVDVLPDPNTYRVTFRNLTMTPELLNQFSGDRWSRMPTPGWEFPAPEVIHGGDVIALTLLSNPTTQQRVVDYVTVQEPSRGFNGFDPVPERVFSYVPGPSRDFELDDVELSIQSPRLSISGVLDETSAGRFGSVVGGVVWIYTAGYGRFLLSLVPHPDLGFRKAGEVRGTSLSFAIGGDRFDLSTGARIAPGESAFSLYVLHEPDWKPSYPNADLSYFTMGVLDRPELLSGQRD